jgi:4-amino-4-deoxy-L-arabinose transferase-like glycosyltransferase
MNLLDKISSSQATATVPVAAADKTRPWLNLLIWHLGVPFVFVVVVFFFFPYSATFEFSTDEGINLMKAMLVDHGYSLYADIWSDQPPLFTYLLVLVFRIFGLKVGAARFFVLLLSALLMWASFQFTRLVWGKYQALAGAVVLFLLPKYMLLSAAVMVGLPSIVFATLSLLALGLWHMQRKPMWMLLSATALGLSVLTKLFTGFLAPIFVLGLLANGLYRSQKRKNWREILTPPVLWGVVFTVVTLGLGLALVGPGNIPQLLEPHITATQVADFQKNELLTLHWHLRQAKTFLFLALVGTVLTVRSKRWLYLYPLAWMVAAYLLLFQHTPVWEHQQLLVTIPAAMLGGIAFYEGSKFALQYIRSYKRSWTGLLRAAAFVGAFFLIFSFRIAEPINLLTLTPSITNSEFEMGPLEEKFYTKMLKFAPETKWVVTDLTMYAFRARLPVPPNLAVFSLKRVQTGNLTEAQVLDTIREYNPEQVLLGRFEFPVVEKSLGERYRLVHVDDYTRLYIRKDLGG